MPSNPTSGCLFTENTNTHSKSHTPLWSPQRYLQQDVEGTSVSLMDGWMKVRCTHSTKYHSATRKEGALPRDNTHGP